MGLSDEQIQPVKTDATQGLPFAPNSLDGLISIDSYHYFCRDAALLDEKILPALKPGAYLYIAIPGMKRDCHDNLPPELLLSWTPEQLDYIHDAQWWRNIISGCRGAEVLDISEMASNDEVWQDWLQQDNEYAVNDRKAFAAGGGKYLNFIKIVLRKK